MAIREKMNHVAAGLLDSFYSRRNSLEGFWTLGVLYEEVQSEPHHVELDLLARAAIPPGPNALLIAARYGDFLQHALEKKGLRIEELTRASVTIQFKAKVSVPRSQPHWVGDSFSCTVTLQRMDRKVAYTANGKCMPNDPRLFSRGG